MPSSLDILAASGELLFHADSTDAVASAAARLLATHDGVVWVSVEVPRPDGRLLAVAHREPAMEAVLRRVRQASALDERDPFTLAVGRASTTQIDAVEAAVLFPGLADGAVFAMPLGVAGRAAHGAVIVGCDASSVALDVLERVATRVSAALSLAREIEAARSRHMPSLQALAMVAHDLRNPLSTIAASAALAGMTVRGSGYEASVGRAVSAIEDAVRASARMVSDLLDVTTVEGGRITVVREVVDIAALASEAVAGFASDANRAAVELSADVEANLPRVSCDPARIRQVLANLVGNALKFTPPGKAVVVRVRRKHSVVTLTVRDTGKGISDEELAHVTRPFWHKPQSGNRGHGLGLFITKAIVEAHGSALLISSSPSGTTVEFALSVAATQGVAAGGFADRERGVS